MKVTKYSGELVHYDEQKLINSLRKSGADQAMAEAIVKEIESEMYEGISSKKIYKRAYQLLKNISNVHAARYNLKSTIGLFLLWLEWLNKLLDKLENDQPNL